jgi:hypothetical protein
MAPLSTFRKQLVALTILSSTAALAQEIQLTNYATLNAKGVLAVTTDDQYRYFYDKFLAAKLLGRAQTWYSLDTQGDPTFFPNDFLDLSSLADKLATPRDKLTLFLKETLDHSAVDVLAKFKQGSATKEQAIRLLISSFNKVVLDGPIYTKDRFAGIQLDAKTQ